METGVEGWLNPCGAFQNLKRDSQTSGQGG